MTVTIDSNRLVYGLQQIDRNSFSKPGKWKYACNTFYSVKQHARKLPIFTLLTLRCDTYDAFTVTQILQIVVNSRSTAVTVTTTTYNT